MGAGYVHYRGPYSSRTRCGRTQAMRPQTTDSWLRVSCPKCNKLHDDDAKRSVKRGDFELTPGNDTVGNAVRRPLKKEAVMQMSLSDVRRTVREVINEASGGYSASSFMVVDPDGRRYPAEPTRVRRWLISNTQMSADEREQVMSTGEVSAGVLSRMKRDGVVSSSVDKPPPRERKGPSAAGRGFKKRERDRDTLVRDRQKADRAYTKAVRDFARSWEDFDEQHVDPEGAASDAALGFFETYASEWPAWARLLDMRKSDMHGAVTDNVYDAMTKKKPKRGTVGETVRRIVRGLLAGGA